ncbi:MAG: oxidoreductase [Marmoricola sp.]|nr:oxidoreductase [Marmoricola sp.]
MSKKSRETGRAERTQRAAAVRREQASRERNRKVGVIAAVVVLLAVIVGAGVFFSRQGGSDSASASPGSLPPASASGQALVVGKNAQAKLKVVVYEDFLCPYCREFESSSRSALHDAAAKGTVQVEYRPFHLLQDDYSSQALAAWAAVLQQGTPKQALALHDLLYENQPYEQDPSKPGPAQFVQWAKKAGVTRSSVLDAVRQASDQTFVDATDAAAKKAGVTGTPTVFVNGKQLGGTSVSDEVRALEKMISQA